MPCMHRSIDSHSAPLATCEKPGQMIYWRPTRTARFGNSITRFGMLNLRNSKFKDDFGPVEDGCECICCRKEGGLGVTRAFVHHIAGKETVGAHLLTIHNVWYQLALMRSVRTAIIEDRFPAFLKRFFKDYFGDKTRYPDWAIEALGTVGVDLMEP